VALHDVSKLGDVMTALLSCVFGEILRSHCAIPQVLIGSTALQLMFLAGWVHRDISSGNLYWFEGNNGPEVRGILADLEYARRFRPSDGNPDPKTVRMTAYIYGSEGSLTAGQGTAFFMAVEIQKQVLLYIPQLPLDENLSGFLAGNITTSPELQPHPMPPDINFVVHNFEHDMESIFWLLLWTLLVRFPCNLDSNKERSEFAGILSEIFQDTSICSRKRERVFSQMGFLHDLLARFLAPQLKPLQAPLDALRTALVTGYLRRKHEFNDLSSYSILYKFLRMTLIICQHLTQKQSLPDLLPCRSLYLNSVAAQAEIVNLPLQVNKRRRSQSNAGDDDNEYGLVVSSKVAQGQGSTDVSSSWILRERNPGVSYIESDSDSSRKCHSTWLHS